MMRAAAVATGLGLLLTSCSVADNAGDDARHTSAAPSEAIASTIWTPIADSPLSQRTASVGAWTGTELLVVGGVNWVCPPGADCPGPRGEDYLLDGAAYDPLTDTWRELPDAPREAFHDSATWTGSDLVIVHSPTRFESGDARLPAAVTALNPTANTWRTLDPPPADQLMGGVWTGEAIVFWHAEDESGGLHSLDPVSGSWSTLPPDPLGPSFDRSMSWLGDSLYLTGVRKDDTSQPKEFLLTVLDPADGRWSEPVVTPVTFWAQTWFAFDGQLVNASQDVTRGYESAFAPIHGALDPTTGAWSDVAQVDDYDALEDGCQLPVIGPARDWLAPGGSVLVSLDPPAATTTPPCPSLPEPSVGGWTGTEFVIWGGIDQTGNSNSAAGLRWTPPAP